MSDHRRRRLGARAALAVLSTSALVLLPVAPVSADDDTNPIEQLTQQVDQVVHGLMKTHHATTQAAQKRAAAPVAVDDDSPGHETTDPVAPDHASAQGLFAGLAGSSLVSVGDSRGEIRDDHASSADASALAIGGQEVLGAHADSGGTEKQSAGDPLAPVCSSSSGAICATVLYADAEADEGTTTSDSSAHSGVASACVGGSDATGASCSGPVGVGVLQSSGSISRDGSGHTKGSSASSVADVCLAPVPLAGCTVGADAVSSSGSSDSRGTASKQSNVLGLALGGQGGDFTTPTAIALPPGCTSPSIACVFLNQGETYLGDGIAGHAVAALDASVLDGNVLADAAQSETLVHQAGPRSEDLPNGPGGPGDHTGNGGPKNGGPGNGPADSPADDALPNTGGVWSGLLAIGLLTVAAGGFVLAWSRRREMGDAAA